MSLPLALGTKGEQNPTGQAGSAGASGFTKKAGWPERRLRSAKFPEVTARLGTLEAWGLCLASPGVRPHKAQTRLESKPARLGGWVG